MRFNRLGALLAWLAMASFAIAGFAAFSATSPADLAATPEAVTDPAGPVTTATASALGNAAGRVAAMSLVPNAATSTLNASRPALAQKEALRDAVAVAEAPTTTQAPTTTTEAPPTTEAPTTTEAPSATEPPATTAPPTTEAPPATEPPVETVYVPPGTEPWVGLVEASFAAGDVGQALMVISCESGGNPSATNASSGAAGLFQHLPKYWAERSAAAGWEGADIYDPAANIAVAAWLVYEGGGWSHWGPSAGCWG